MLTEFGDQDRLPQGAEQQRDKRYRVADPYLRFYLSFLRRGLPLVERGRGRGDLVLLSIERSWGTWRGRAIEPVIRDALLRIAPELGFPQVAAVGGWWNRRNTPQIDIVAKNDERRSGIALPAASSGTRPAVSASGSTMTWCGTCTKCLA